MATEDSSSRPAVDVPVDLRRAAAEAGWPPDLIERALALRTNRSLLTFYMEDERVDAQVVDYVLRGRERLLTGTLRLREATWEDDEGLADLYANSAEQIGEWLVTVERSPYPFAQFRLQEQPTVHVLEDRGELLATVAHSTRNTFVGGRPLSVHVASALRVRNDRRGSGYGRLISNAEGPEWKWWANVHYWYVRSGNFDAYHWVQERNAIEPLPGNEGDVPGLPVTVHYYTARPFAGDAAGIRLANPADITQCVGLINRTHEGLDFFRPYSTEFLETRLDDAFWGPKPSFWTHVYGWPEYHVLEEGRRVVACAGLWDRAEHVREIWHSRETGERQTIACTGLMDFGYAEGREDAMARLIEYLAGLTHELGRDRPIARDNLIARDHLIAPLEYLPELRASLAGLSAGSETRSLQWRTSLQSPELRELKPTRPYTDLGYW